MPISKTSSDRAQVMSAPSGLDPQFFVDIGQRACKSWFGGTLGTRGGNGRFRQNPGAERLGKLGRAHDLHRPQPGLRMPVPGRREGFSGLSRSGWQAVPVSDEFRRIQLSRAAGPRRGARFLRDGAHRVIKIAGAVMSLDAPCGHCLETVPPCVATLLSIYIGDDDTFEDKPLADQIIVKARAAGLAGATVTRGNASLRPCQPRTSCGAASLGRSTDRHQHCRYRREDQRVPAGYRGHGR